MQLPLTIGRDSSGKDHTIDLCSLPNLVISYNEDEQLSETFVRLIKNARSTPSVQLAISIGSKLAESLDPVIHNNQVLINFQHSQSTGAEIKSIDQFVDALVIQLKTRKKMQKTSPHTIIYPLVVFIDNIFEVVMSNRRKTALLFVELLVSGARQSIYFVAGSTGMYKNILDQIIHLNPKLKAKLEKSSPGIKINEPLAAEMIINPDGLIFFKQRGEKVYLRLYPV